MTLVSTLKARYRYSIILLKQLVKTDFKLRYQNSILGYLWSLLRPLLLFLILYLVFTVFLPVGKGVPHYPQYLLLGIVLWNFFTEVTNGGVGAIVGKGDLLRKINFPRYVVILAVAASAFINLILNFVVVAIFMVFGHVAFGWNDFMLLPLIAELFIFAIGIAFFLGAFFVRFRDVSYIWEVAMQAGFYGTPILYPLSQIHQLRFKKLLLLNPMAQIIQDARHLVITPYSATIHQVYGNNWVWAVPLLVVATTTVVGITYFRSRAKHFAEEV